MRQKVRITDSGLLETQKRIAKLAEEERLRLIEIVPDQKEHTTDWWMPGNARVTEFQLACFRAGATSVTLYPPEKSE